MTPRDQNPRAQLGLGSRRHPRQRIITGPPIAAPLRPASHRVARFRPVLSALFAVIFVTSATTFMFPFIPALQYKLSHHTLESATSTIAAASVTPQTIEASHNRVIIPKVGIDTAILEGPSLDVLNMAEGVWHQTGTLNKNNFVLAGHRFKYFPPNTSTLYNLNKLTAGDTIIVDWGGQRSVYVITELKTVPNTAVNILDSGPKPQLTIYTCNDVHMTQRVVAIATPLQ